MLQTDGDLGKSSSRAHPAIVAHIKGYFKASIGNATRQSRPCQTMRHEKPSTSERCILNSLLAGQ